jgi:hypothetical protein
MPTFVAFILARLVYDVLAPYGVQALNVGLSLVAWFVCFSVCKSFLAHIRPGA